MLISTATLENTLRRIGLFSLGSTEQLMLSCALLSCLEGLGVQYEVAFQESLEECFVFDKIDR